MSERPRGAAAKKKHHPVVFFFCCGPAGSFSTITKTRPGRVFFCLLWPLFAPRHWFIEIFLLSAPGVQSVFFVVAPRWAPRPFGGARAKKQHHQGVFFLLRPRGKAGEGEAPLGAGTGPEQKINTTQGVCFFCCGPGERQGKEKPRWAGWCFFFALAPPKGRGAQRGATKKKHFAHPGPTAKQFLETNDAGHEQKGATTKKKHPGQMRSMSRPAQPRWWAPTLLVAWPKIDFCSHSLTALGSRN